MECFQLEESTKESLGIEGLQEFYEHLASQIVNGRYKFLTLQNYKLQGGEKIVWLGLEESTTAQRTFGKVYDVIHDYSDEIFYRDDNGTCYEIKSDNWGVIPNYQQLQKPTESNPYQYDIYEQIAMKHNLTVEELCFILDEVDKGRKKIIINNLIGLRRKWIKDDTRGI